MEKCLLYLFSIGSQFLDFIRLMVFDLFFYCVTVKTIYWVLLSHVDARGKKLNNCTLRGISLSSSLEHCFIFVMTEFKNDVCTYKNNALQWPCKWVVLWMLFWRFAVDQQTKSIPHITPNGQQIWTWHGHFLGHFSKNNNYWCL